MDKTGKFEDFIGSFSVDKEVVIPGIGETTCSGLQDTFHSCQKNIVKDSQIYFCNQFLKLSRKCFLKTPGEFAAYLDMKKEKEQRLMDYLTANGSNIPYRLEQSGLYNMINLMSPKEPNEKPTDIKMDTDKVDPETKVQQIQEKIASNKEYFKSN